VQKCTILANCTVVTACKDTIVILLFTLKSKLALIDRGLAWRDHLENIDPQVHKSHCGPTLT